MNIIRIARRSARATLDSVRRTYVGARIYEGPHSQVRIELDLHGLGLFAHLNVVAGLAYRLGRRKKNFSVRCVTRCYSNGGDEWFGALFEDRHPLTSEDGPFVRIGSESQLPRVYRGERLTLQSAKEAFFEKYAIRAELAVAAEEFARKYFQDGKILGVHYRGTDKIAEAPRAEYDSVMRAIRRKTDTGAYGKIFVATDEERFIEHLSRHAPCEVVFQELAVRSQSNVPIHLRADADGLNRAKQAMLDMQLLARCDAMVKTASALSGWSVLMNPAMDVEFINRPKQATTFFPDSLILERLDREGMPGGLPVGA